MAALNNINPLSPAPAAAPTTNPCTAGPDTFPAAIGARYLCRFNNTGGAPVTVTADDPVSVSPPNATAFNPDVPCTVTNAQARAMMIDANRHRDPVTGLVTLTYSVTPTMTVEIHGPL